MKIMSLILCALLISTAGCGREVPHNDPFGPDKPDTPEVPDVPDPEPGARLTQLRVMTYNIHSAVPDESVAKVADIEGIAAVIKAVDPDIVFLQEVDQYANRYGSNDDQAAVLATLTKRHCAYFPARRQGAFGYYGVAILSRYPLSDKKTYNLPRKEKLEQRVLGTVTVALPGGEKITAAVTHLQHNDAENRIDQVKEIIRLLENPAYPVVLGGDFNEKTSTAGFFTLWDAAFQRTCTQYGCPNTFPARNPTSEIDFLSFRPKEAFTVVEHRVETAWKASDHCPVVAVLKPAGN